MRGADRERRAERCVGEERKEREFGSRSESDRRRRRRRRRRRNTFVGIKSVMFLSGKGG